MGQVGKLNYVDGKLGAPTSGQQTTRILFSTITAPGTVSQLEFFKNFQGLTPGQTNLNASKLDSMESMIVKSIWLLQLGTAGQSLLFGLSSQQTMDILIGNQTVVKDLQFTSIAIQLGKRLTACTLTAVSQLMKRQRLHQLSKLCRPLKLVCSPILFYHPK
jgi:hypothetical protein